MTHPPSGGPPWPAADRPPPGPSGPYGPPGPSGQHGPPPGYGYPPGGPQAGPPPRSRAGLALGLVALALLIVAAAILLPLVLGGQVLDRAAVERDVAGQFAEVHGVEVDLRCPDGMDLEDGAAYECAGSTADGEEITLRIVVTDADAAAYTWAEV